MREPTGRAVFYLGASGAGMLLPMLTLPVLTRVLRPEDFGVLALGYVAALAFRGVAGLGVTTGLERNFFAVESDREALGTLLFTALAVVAVSACAWGLALAGILQPLAQWMTGDRRWAPLLGLMCAAAALGVPSSMYLTYLRNRGAARAYLMWGAAGGLLEAALSVGLAAGAGLGIWGVVWAQVIGKALVVAVSWGRLAVALPVRIDGAAARELLSIGLPVTPKVLVQVVNTGIDRMLLAWLGSLGHAGIFGIGHRVGYAAFEATTAVEHVYLPEMYRRMFAGGPDARHALGRYLTPFAYASFLIGIGVVLWTEPAVRLLLPPAYHGVTPVAVILTAAYTQMFFGKLTGAQWIYMRRTWYVPPQQALALVLRVALAWWCIPRWGAMGAALAMWASGSVVDALSFWSAQRLYPIAYEWRALSAMLAMLYAGVAWALLPQVATVAPGWHAAGAAALMGAYGLLGRRWWHALRGIRGADASTPAPEIPGGMVRAMEAESVS